MALFFVVVIPNPLCPDKGYRQDISSYTVLNTVICEVCGHGRKLCRSGICPEGNVMQKIIYDDDTYTHTHAPTRYSQAEVTIFSAMTVLY